MRPAVLGRAETARGLSKCGGRLIETEERRRQTKSGFATRKEAQTALSKLLVSVAEKSYVAATRLTLREYLSKEWLPAIEATVRPSTFRSYKQHVECHICPQLGSVQLQKLSGSQINALYAKLALSGKKDGKSGLSALTIRHVHTCLHRALKDAVRWERLTRSPIEAADPPSIRGDGTRELKTWSAEQLKAFLDSTKGERLSPLWHLLAMTGMRRGEALGLRWEDVDLEAGRLSVRRALIPNGAIVVVSEPKTARGRRSVALDPETIEALKRQAAQQLADQLEKGDKWSDTGLVFTKEDGEAWLSGGRLPLLPPSAQAGGTAGDPPPRPQAHARHPGAAGRHPPQGCLGTPRARDHRHHAGHLLARHPGDARRGGGADCGARVRGEVGPSPVNRAPR